MEVHSSSPIDQTQREPIHLLHRPAAGHGRSEVSPIKRWETSVGSMEQHPEWRFLAGDLNRSVSCSSFLAREKKREAMDRNGRRSLARQCCVAGARHPVDPSTRSLPKDFFFQFGREESERMVSRNEKKKTRCCQDIFSRIREENETAPHPIWFAFCLRFFNRRSEKIPFFRPVTAPAESQAAAQRNPQTPKLDENSSVQYLTILPRTWQNDRSNRASWSSGECQVNEERKKNPQGSHQHLPRKQ